MSQSTREVFVTTIQSKMPQTPPDLIETFFDFHRDQGCPKGFLDRVSNTFRYIPNIEMAEVATSTAAQLALMIQGEYNTWFDKSNSSMRWAYERLLEGGMKSATMMFSQFDKPEYIYRPWQYLQYEDKDIPLLITDDWSIGGEQMENWASTFSTQQHLFLAPFFVSRNALKRIEEANPAATVVSLGQPIETFDEAFNKDDYEYMEAIYAVSVGTKELFNSNMFRQFALVTSDHFTPDNFPGLFLERRRFKATNEQIPGLIRPHRPNYRRVNYTKTKHGK